MSLSIYLVIFLFGLAIGSFLNCAVFRLEKEESFLSGRSYCPNCKHKLSWHDLIPLFSFLALGGRCRYCKNKISFRYPLVELATGLIFLLIFVFQFTAAPGFFIFSFQNLIAFFYLLTISCFLIVIFIYDLKTYLIPDGAVFSALAVSGVWYLASGIFFHIYTKYQILSTIYSAIGAAAFFLAIFLISRGRWMGFGDVKLAFLLGLFLGWPKILPGLFLAFFIGAIIGLGAIMLGKKKISSEVPFGPFLVLGTFLALFFGQSIISWYLNFLQ
jgi:leader peptidase (prepilin peptidase) / N-methyltransferase